MFLNEYDECLRLPIRLKEEQLRKQLAQEQRQAELKAQQEKEKAKKEEDAHRFKQEEEKREQDVQEKDQQMDKEVSGHHVLMLYVFEYCVKYVLSTVPAYK